MQILKKLIRSASENVFNRFPRAQSLQILDQRISDCMNIISFSLFGSNRRYLDGALQNIESYKIHFPEFRCRFYVASDIPKSFINSILDEDSELVVMNGTGVDYLYTFWRFYAAEDLTKDIFLIRDIDSIPSQRERHFYLKWRKSNKKFNIIRDHYSHNSLMMAGMWGGETSTSLITSQIDKLWQFPNRYDRDQLFLNKLIYPKIIQNCHVQDIFHRYINEMPEINPVDDVDYSFIGEIATDKAKLNEWRQEFRRLHENFKTVE